jgi:hypothetical protein
MIGIGLALVGAIRITASGEDMGMMSQQIEQSASKFFVSEDLEAIDSGQSLVCYRLPSKVPYAPI